MIEVKEVDEWFSQPQDDGPYTPTGMLNSGTSIGRNDTIASFNNRRVLHGRTSIPPGAGKRCLQGCYVDWDGMLSNLAVLGRGL